MGGFSLFLSTNSVLQVIFIVYEVASCSYLSVYSFLTVLGQDETNLALRWYIFFALQAYLGCPLTGQDIKYDWFQLSASFSVRVKTRGKATLHDETGGPVDEFSRKRGFGEKRGLPLMKGGILDHGWNHAKFGPKTKNHYILLKTLEIVENNVRNHP